MTIETVFYTQLVSIIGFISALFVVYRALVSQKDATIQLLKERNVDLSEKLIDASKNSPDALAKSLSDRVKLLEDEIERLSKDKESNQEQIKKKEIERDIVKEEAEDLSRQFAKVYELLKDGLSKSPRIYSDLEEPKNPKVGDIWIPTK